MAGSAKTQNFLVATATVMLGPKADLYKFMPDTHGLGLVKNFQMQSQPTFTDLTQGLQNDVVASFRSAHGVTATWETYEYTTRNIAYGQGIDASGVAFNPLTAPLAVVSTAVAAAATTVVVDGDVTANFANGDTIFIQKGVDDYVFVAKLSAAPAVATGKTTLTFAGYPVPAGIAFPVGSRVGKLRGIELGGSALQAELAARVTGIMPKDNRPFILDFPRVKITQGGAISFASDQWQNMPFGFTPFACTSDDPLSADFGDKVARLYSPN